MRGVLYAESIENAPHIIGRAGDPPPKGRGG